MNVNIDASLKRLILANTLVFVNLWYIHNIRSHKFIRCRMDEEKLPPISRPMYEWEINEARRVFGDRLAYKELQIHEGASWPDSINQVGAMVKRIQVIGVHNAITLGNDLYFPLRLPPEPLALGDAEYYKIPWLMHELTHAWQYQHIGWRYLAQALYAQVRLGARAYDFGDEAGLIESYKMGWRLHHFNPEQQGDIARSYYSRLVSGVDVSAWLPFVTELQQTIDY